MSLVAGYLAVNAQLGEIRQGGPMTKSGRIDHDLGGWVHHRPNDGPGQGLGEGGERLHYWVFGGPWSYDQDG
jgi:hypothetical protein